MITILIYVAIVALAIVAIVTWTSVNFHNIVAKWKIKDSDTAEFMTYNIPGGTIYGYYSPKGETREELRKKIVEHYAIEKRNLRPVDEFDPMIANVNRNRKKFVTQLTSSIRELAEGGTKFVTVPISLATYSIFYPNRLIFDITDRTTNDAFLIEGDRKVRVVEDDKTYYFTA